MFVSLAIPRVSEFQPKAKSRARKPNNASNAPGKTKNNPVDKKPSKQHIIKVDLFETKADEKDNTVTFPASPLKDPVGSSIIVPNPPAENPIKEISILDAGTQLGTPSTPPASGTEGGNLLPVQEPVFVASIQEPLDTTPSSPLVKEAPISVASEPDPLIREVTPQLSPRVENLIEEVLVNENSKGEEHLLSLVNASLELSAHNSDESHSSDDAYNDSLEIPSLTEDDKR